MDLATFAETKVARVPGRDPVISITHWTLLFHKKVRLVPALRNFWRKTQDGFSIKNVENDVGVESLLNKMGGIYWIDIHSFREHRTIVTSSDTPLVYVPLSPRRSQALRLEIDTQYGIHPVAPEIFPVLTAFHFPLTSYHQPRLQCDLGCA